VATLTIGSRRSQLARTQSEIVRRQLLDAWGDLEVTIELIDTSGDLNRRDPLPQIGGKGLFTYELEEALRRRQIDLAVHSLKDLPVDDSPGLVVSAILERADTQDMLVSRKASRLEGLPPEAVVGTSSLRRAAQILALRHDLIIKDIRGNVGTRLRKLDDPAHGYDAILLAKAGLDRLGHTGLEHAHPIPLGAVLPAPGQGALAVQSRTGDPETSEYMSALDHHPTRAAVTAERAFLAALGGGCAMPVAALGLVAESVLVLNAVVASPDGRQTVRVSRSGTVNAPESLGQLLAEEAIARGASALLAAHAAD
jgi:hydroxymethylbilane synthase